MMSDVGTAVGRISSAGAVLFESKPRRSSKAKIVRGLRKEDPNLFYLKSSGFSSDKSLSPKGITRETRRLTSSGSVFIWRGMGWDGRVLFGGASLIAGFRTGKHGLGCRCRLSASVLGLAPARERAMTHRFPFRLPARYLGLGIMQGPFAPIGYCDPSTGMARALIFCTGRSRG